MKFKNLGNFGYPTLKIFENGGRCVAAQKPARAISSWVSLKVAEQMEHYMKSMTYEAFSENFFKNTELFLEINDLDHFFGSFSGAEKRTFYKTAQNTLHKTAGELLMFAIRKKLLTSTSVCVQITT